MKRFLLKTKPIRLGRWGKSDWIKVDHANLDSGYISTLNVKKDHLNEDQNHPSLDKRPLLEENTRRR